MAFHAFHTASFPWLVFGRALLIRFVRHALWAILGGSVRLIPRALELSPAGCVVERDTIRANHCARDIPLENHERAGEYGAKCQGLQSEMVAAGEIGRASCRE